MAMVAGDGGMGRVGGLWTVEVTFVPVVMVEHCRVAAQEAEYVCRSSLFSLRLPYPEVATAAEV
jgi:hypothetical protein